MAVRERTGCAAKCIFLGLDTLSTRGQSSNFTLLHLSLSLQSIFDISPPPFAGWIFEPFSSHKDDPESKGQTPAGLAYTSSSCSPVHLELR